MATAEGYLRRLTRRLTEDPEQRDVEELTDEAASTGAQKAIDCQRGQEVTMVGTLRSVEANAKGCAGGVRGRTVRRHRLGDAGLAGAAPHRRHRIRPHAEGARPARQAGQRRQGDLQPPLRDSTLSDPGTEPGNA